MIEAKKFVGIISQYGSSIPFSIICGNRKKWVVKAKKIGKNSKRLLSEYLSGILAKEIGLSRPNVELVRISNNIFEELRQMTDVFDVSCSFGVAIEYFEGLVPVLPPPNVELSSPDLPKRNKEYLSGQLFDEKSFDQFYGLNVFSEWILLRDYHKYSNLQKTNNNEVIFLDFDMAFRSNGDDFELPTHYDYVKMISLQAPFLEGIITQKEKFVAWFNKLELLEKNKLSDKILEIPNCWGVPDNYTDSLLNFLFDHRKEFVEQFLKAFEFREETSEFD
ncbi:MAG: hypothetical protein SCARUB_04315 [Candidatus Scalindua rubra]|uniref:HipA-like kinase domain-containing protein n=1 Tax=Candidatus Scalindua rubra TaxID=1872076 RepID=A0A1E3X4N1_9BACT|nr:MAG: hypothetical protein SCARUB_04315 [Candidatus Scalindua rubra]